MGSYSISLLTKKLLESEFKLIDSKTLKQLLEIENERTFFRIIEDFVKSKILVNLEKDKYYITGKKIDTFEIANYLYQPSYVSLESSLNYWGVLSQFPFEITSVTLKKGIIKKSEEKIYSYSHISSKYFGMYVKKNNILIATPEKALFDLFYLASKGIRSVNVDEYDLKNINKKIFLKICKQLDADKNIYAYI